MIPNIVHFIYPVWPNTRPLSYVNYMAVKMARVVQKPDRIKFWINKEPEPSEWWDKIKELVDVVYTPMDGVYRGVKIEWPQLQSDVTRLEILQREGGIYLDTDMLLRRFLDYFLHLDQAFTVGLEPQGDSVCNALMISPPNAEFVKAWLDKIPEGLQSKVWAHSGVITPRKLLGTHGGGVYLKDAECFCPLDLSKNWMFDPALVDEAEALVKNSYSVHVFETYWRIIVKDVTPEWCEKNDCLFSRLVAPYRD